MILREIERDLKFIKHHTLQPRWWKFAKVAILIGAIATVCLFYGAIRTVIWVSVVVALSLTLHLVYRAKTRVFTRTWMDFKVLRKRGKRTYGRIGWLYYTLVALILTAATLAAALIRL